MTHRSFALPLALASLLAVECGGGKGPMMGRNPSGPGSMGASLLSVTPPGGATAVSVAAPILLRFGAAMAVGMEQYVDLHVGDLGGPIVPMSCAWSADRTVLTCTPSAPLSSHTTYVVHLGGGMRTQEQQVLDYTRYGPMVGGQWIMGGLMGRSHGGGPWDTMAPGWRNTNGSYGMTFTFTTL